MVNDYAVKVCNPLRAKQLYSVIWLLVSMNRWPERMVRWRD